MHSLNNPQRFQFGTKTLVVLTSVFAVILALALRFQAPALIQLALAMYLMCLASWGIIRGPQIYRRLVQLTARRREIRKQREQLVSQIARKLDENIAKLKTANDRS
jgi:type IV secretory pathway TrbD component